MREWREGKGRREDKEGDIDIRVEERVGKERETRKVEQGEGLCWGLIEWCACPQL